MADLVFEKKFFEKEMCDKPKLKIIDNSQRKINNV